jgi:hypothetical protein
MDRDDPVAHAKTKSNGWILWPLAIAAVAAVVVFAINSHEPQPLRAPTHQTQP